jgi:hypothetical protein
MTKSQIKSRITIAVSMLGEVRKDGYGNRRINHADRDFVTQSVTELLTDVLIAIDNLTCPIISNSTQNINPPDES